jgi:hypothetical protein
MAAPAAPTAAASSLVAVKLDGASTRRVIEFPGLGFAIEFLLVWPVTGRSRFDGCFRIMDIIICLVEKQPLLCHRPGGGVLYLWFSAVFHDVDKKCRRRRAGENLYG